MGAKMPQEGPGREAASIRERAFSTYEAPRLPALSHHADDDCDCEDDFDDSDGAPI